MKKSLWLGLLLPATLVTTVAHADDRAACLDAVSKGQTLRASHKLVEAREQFRICAGAGCPGVIQSDCANWLSKVEDALPGVVLAAKNGAGADLVDVKVSVDGKPLVSKLDGEVLPMDAGPHMFHFEAADGTTLDRQFVIKEWAKDQNISVVLGNAPAATPAPPSAAPAEVPQAQASAAPEQGANPLRTVGWVTGAVGVVGLGVGAIFGMMAISDKSSAHCDASSACDAGPLSDAHSAATISTIGVVAGGVLLAGGAALVLFSGKHGATASPSASLVVAPLVGVRDAGLSLRGAW